MRNVDLHVDSDSVLHIRRLRGELISNTKGSPPIFDEKRSFDIRIQSGQFALDVTSLSRIVNRYVLASDDAPLRDLQISADGRRLKQKGVLRKGVPIPFTMIAEISATPAGLIRLHPVSFKAVGVPVKGLLDAFGVELERLIKLSDTPAMKMDGDDMLLDPEQLLPPPYIHGRLVKVWVESDRVVQTWGADEAERLAPDNKVRNYMYYRGGVLRFGKLTMHDADLELIDADPTDPFDFNQAEYIKQLVAGYSRNTPTHGLRVFMPDANQAGKPLTPRTSRSIS